MTKADLFCCSRNSYIMWMRLIAFLALISTGSGAGASRFEGKIDFRVTSRRKGEPAAVATQRMFLSPRGSRWETLIGGGVAPGAVLRLTSNPAIRYVLDDRRKIYTVKGEPQSLRIEPEKFRLRKLAPSRLGGYRCDHVILTGDRGNVVEQWLTVDIRGLEHWSSETTRGNGLNAASSAALKRARVDGLPVKIVMQTTSGLVLTWEITSVEKRAVADSLFDFAGYRETDGGDDDG